MPNFNHVSSSIEVNEAAYMLAALGPWWNQDAWSESLFFSYKVTKDKGQCFGKYKLSLGTPVSIT